MASFKYKGFVLTQCEKGEHHYMIYEEESDSMVCHSAYTGGLFTQAEVEHAIDNFIMIRDKLPQILEDVGGAKNGKGKEL